jgi:hypothetical protein
MRQQVSNPRISEQPENYRSVYDAAMKVAQGVADGAIEVSEATAAARNLGVAAKTLDGDLKSRLVERKLAAKLIGDQKQIAA